MLWDKYGRRWCDGKSLKRGELLNSLNAKFKIYLVSIENRDKSLMEI